MIRNVLFSPTFSLKKLKITVEISKNISNKTKSIQENLVRNMSIHA
jgi:hypothetical protein